MSNIDRFIGEIQRARPGDTIIVHTANDPDSESLEELLNTLAKIGYDFILPVIFLGTPFMINVDVWKQEYSMAGVPILIGWRFA